MFYVLYYLLRGSSVFNLVNCFNDTTHSQSNYDSGIYLEGIRYFIKKYSLQNTLDMFIDCHEPERNTSTHFNTPKSTSK